MTEGQKDREVLFKVGDREIVRNGLYAVMGPGGPTREMVIDYDPATNMAKWVQPNASRFYSDGNGLMAIMIDVGLFEDAFDASKPYLRFRGGKIELDMGYRPTPEHWKILSNWNAELDRAGIGGIAIDLTKDEVKPEFRAEYGFE